MPTRIPKIDPPGAFADPASFRYSPLHHVRSLYLQFVQGLFYTAPAGQFHWEEDTQKTEIIITGESPLHVDTLNDRPGIAFTRAPVGVGHLGFDDMLSFDLTTGRKVKTMLIPGTMVINCCSRVDLESEYLAWVVFEHLWLLRDILMKAGFYDIGRNLQLSAPSKPGDIVAGDGADEWFCTSVTSPYHFPRMSSLTPLNQQIIREIQLRLGLNRPAPLRPGIPVPGYPTVDPPYQSDVFPPPPYTPAAGSPNTRTLQNLGGLPTAPHPLNPAQTVVVRSIRADQPGLRPPSIGGRSLPISSASVEESVSATVIKTTVKT